MKVLFWVMISFGLTACSTTTSDVRQLMNLADRSKTGEISLAIGAEKIQTTSQDDTRLYKLHHSGAGVTRITREVASLYGFKLTDADLNVDAADYYLHLTKAMPDGGACIGWLGSIAQGLSFTVSVMTFGIVPASGGHCLVVNATLYRVEAGEQVIAGEFMSNAGRVDVYAGANEVDNYQLVVDRADEARGLEASIGGLLNKVLVEHAFE